MTPPQNRSAASSRPKPGSWINRHQKGAPASAGGRFRGNKREEPGASVIVAPPITYRDQPNLGHGRDLDLYAEQYPDMEVFSFDDGAEVNPASLDRRGLGEYVGILANGYGD